MRPDPGRDLLDERIRAASVDERVAWITAKRALGFLLVWQQADAAGPMSEVERADFILRRLYPEMPQTWFADVIEKLAARQAAGTWHGFQRPSPLTTPDHLP